MPTLKADENRYLVQAAVADRAKMKCIPGGRWNPGLERWIYRRQQALIRALDRVFPEGWDSTDDLEFDVVDARSRIFEPPVHEAYVRLQGDRLAVECRVEDKELVKLVPGYQWSPAERRWFLDALPLALEILRDGFGEKLIVDEEVETYIHLKRLDEAHELEVARAQAARQPPRPPLPVREVAEETRPLATMSRVGGQPEGSEAVLLEVLARLVAAVERVERKLDSLLAGGTTPTGPSTAVPELATEPAGVEAGPFEEELWRPLFDLSRTDPAAALDEASRRLQTGAEDDSPVRAVAGLAARALGDHDDALRHLRKALDGASALPPDLLGWAEDAYLWAAAGLLNAVCGPALPITGVESLRRCLLDEVVNDAGFDDARIGSREARPALEYLVNDPVLRRLAPEFSDYCRLAHLLGSVRGGQWMVHERVVDVLREHSLCDEAFAIGLVLYANSLMQAAGATDWVDRWPEASDNVLAAEGRFFVQSAVSRLPAVDRGLGGPAALALLACIASGTAEHATVNERRALVDLIRPGEPWREYAEFLAVFRPVAEGIRLSLKHFPGYARTLSRIRLEQSGSYLEEVLYTGESGPGSAIRLIADEVMLAALANGVSDPETQVIQLLDVLEQGSKPDNLLNELSRMVEDAAFQGADRFTREQRLAIFERALATSVKIGHDEDSRQAFHRLVRALADEPATGALLGLCGDHVKGFRPLRIPALLVQMETLLEDGASIEDIIELANPHLAPGRAEELELVRTELFALADLYPEHRPRLMEFLQEKTGVEPAISSTLPEGLRVVVVGGHQRLRARAKPAVEGWGVQVDWLGPDEAKQGPRLPSLVKGACDLVVVNTAYVSHAASGRAISEAEAAGKRVSLQPRNGAGSVLRHIWVELEKFRPGDGNGARLPKKPARPPLFRR
jgi:hypothetical protein